MPVGSVTGAEAREGVCVGMLRRCQGLCWVVIQMIAGFWEAG